MRSEKEVFKLIDACEYNRKTGSTEFNQRSSRSHTIFIANLVRKGVSSRLCLIDLAGSEKATGSCKRQLEGSFINRSLLALGKVVNNMSKSGFIGFRDSKLTRILQPSMDGCSRLVALCTISPSKRSAEESISTLNFVARLGKVKLEPRNEKIECKSPDPKEGPALFCKSCRCALESSEHGRYIPMEEKDKNSTAAEKKTLAVIESLEYHSKAGPRKDASAGKGNTFLAKMDRTMCTPEDTQNIKGVFPSTYTHIYGNVALEQSCKMDHIFGKNNFWLTDSPGGSGTLSGMPEAAKKLCDKLHLGHHFAESSHRDSVLWKLSTQEVLSIANVCNRGKQAFEYRHSHKGNRGLEGVLNILKMENAGSGTDTSSRRLLARDVIQAADSQKINNISTGIDTMDIATKESALRDFGSQCGQECKPIFIGILQENKFLGQKLTLYQQRIDFLENTLVSLYSESSCSNSKKTFTLEKNLFGLKCRLLEKEFPCMDKDEHGCSVL